MMLYSNTAMFSGAGSGMGPIQMRLFSNGPAPTFADPSALAAANTPSHASASASSHKSSDEPKPAMGMGATGLADATAPGIKTAAPAIAHAAEPTLNFVPTSDSFKSTDMIPLIPPD